MGGTRVPSRTTRRVAAVFVLYAAAASAWMLWARHDVDTEIHRLMVNNPRPPERQEPLVPVTLGRISSSIGVTALGLAGLGLVAMTALALVLRPSGRRGSGDSTNHLPRHGDLAGNLDLTELVGSDNDHDQDSAVTPDARSTDITRQLDAVLEIGIVIIGADGRPRYVGERAVEQLAVDGPADGRDALARRIRPLRDDIAAVLRSGGTRKRTLEIGGSEEAREIEATICRLDGDPAPEVMLLLRDREHLPAIEQSLIEATRLRALAGISLGVAHDLRAPMNAIALNLANFKDSLLTDGELTGTEHAETIEMLEDELHRLQRSLELLLRQTSPWSTEREVFALGELLEEVEMLLQAQARQQHLSLRLERPPHELRVCGHRDWIKQAVVNLVVNAFDATTDGGIDIVLDRIDDEARITVADTGSGVSDAILNRMFEAPGSSKSTGLGIGLMVARSAVEAAEGSLDLTRTGADGTTFEIRLPLAEGSDGGGRA